MAGRVGFGVLAHFAPGGEEGLSPDERSLLAGCSRDVLRREPSSDPERTQNRIRMWDTASGDCAMVGAGIAVAAGLRPGVAIAASGTARGHGSVIERDVCVIGGGSSGTYTALRLQDLGKSVVLVEGKDRLGGHCETYHDPETGLTTDIGVTVFHDQPIVRDYFGRFGVPLIPAGELGGGGSGAIYADFRTGLPVDGYVPPVPTALGTYYGILQQYPYLTDGYDLPDPVPAELLLPWGAFVTQYGLGSIAQIAFSFGQGFNNIDQLPAVYVLKYFGLGVVTGILTGSFLTTEGRNNSALYEQATAHLGEDVLLSTTVRSTERDGSSGVLLRVNTPTGPRTIRAGKLVITAPPLLSNLTAFDTDARERALFSRFQHGNYYTGLLELPGVPADLTVSNTGADTPWNLPPLPAVYALSPSSVPGLHDVKYGSAAPLTGPRVRANILADLARIQAAGTLPATQPVFKTYASHAPYELTVSASDIAGGFYRDLYALQGRRHTYWNGAAFQAHDSTLLWQYTETLLPHIAS